MPSQEQRSKVHKLFLYIGIGYVLVVLLYFFFRKPLEDFLCTAFSPDFSTGFSSALAENLLFYFLGLPIAYFSILLSMADPKDSTFETRVKALTNSDNVFIDDELYGYLKDHFTTFLAFTKKNSITVEIRDYNKEKGAYYIYFKTNAIIANMCKDNDFVSTDARAIISPDVEVKGEWGTVIRFETYSTSNLQTISSPYTFHKIDRNFEGKINIDIPKNEEIGLVCEYILWSKIGTDRTINDLWYFFNTQRYTRIIDINIVNKLPSRLPVKFEARCFKNKIKAVDLQEEVSQRYIPLEGIAELQYNVVKNVKYKGDIYPGDQIEFFFYEIQETTGGTNEKD